MDETISFRELDARRGHVLPVLESGEEEFSLPQWYRSVWAVPLDELSDFDVTRALGQRIHLAELLPYALSRVEQEIERGDRYDGEMLMVLMDLGGGFWKGSSHRDRFAALLENRIMEVPEDLQEVARRFLDAIR